MSRRREPNDVLQQFVASISPNEVDVDQSGGGHRVPTAINHLNEQNFASNSVLELFGRTIRGSKKIHQYYRNRMYKHRFDTAVTCEPFENRPSHLETKKCPEENTIDLLTINDSETDICNTPKQRPRTRSAYRSAIAACSSPNSMLLSQTTPPKQKKRRNNSTDDDDGDDDKVNKPSPVPPQHNQSDNDDVVPNLPAEECIGASSRYFTDLQYLEAVGVLHMSQPTKHRGVAPVQSDYSPTNTSDRDVRLRISYRIRHRDQSVQFALIQYEHVTKNPRARRNLLAEFIAIKEEGDDVAATAATAENNRPLLAIMEVTTPPSSGGDKINKSIGGGSTAGLKRKISTSTAWKRLRF